MASIVALDRSTAGSEGRYRVQSKKRITSFDIAKKAGVSQATVSRALRGDPSVSEETRRRVEPAGATPNYTVGKSASNLRGRLTGMHRCRSSKIPRRSSLWQDVPHPEHANKD